jgi:hypothetical protein
VVRGEEELGVLVRVWVGDFGDVGVGVEASKFGVVVVAEEPAVVAMEPACEGTVSPRGPCSGLHPS